MAENSSPTAGTITTRVLFCGLNFPTSFEYTKQYLLPYPFIQVDAIPHDKVPDIIGGYEICVVRGMKLDANVISLARQMKLIVQFGVGLEGVDIEAATKFGIKVARIPGNTSGNSLSCAEHAIYLILGLLRDQDWIILADKMKFPRFDHTQGIVPGLSELEHPFWNKNILSPRTPAKLASILSSVKGMEKAFKERMLGVPAGETLYGKTVHIVGYGNIGKDLAVRLRPFGVKILATRRCWHSKSTVDLNKQDAVYTYPTQSTGDGNIKDDLIDEKGGNECLYDFASRADIVVTCATMTSETVGMVNAKFLSLMKKGAFLVNVARGGLLDYEAVKASLESGHLGGLGADVAWFEPFDPADPILQHPKVFITPHVAGVTEFSYRNMAKIIGDCALHLHNGDSLVGVEIVN